MNATSLVADWRRRLIVLADEPCYVFCDTPPELIAKHRRRITGFEGYSEIDVAKAEARLRVRFPAVFREYLLQMAKAPGELFRGSDLAGVEDFEQFRPDALELLAETDSAPALPAEAIVFLSHQGYQFVYLLAAGGFDAPPMQWVETESDPRQVAPTFAKMVEAELSAMERNSDECRRQGGYYLTLLPGGGATQSFPSIGSGERALDSLASSTPPPRGGLFGYLSDLFARRAQ